MKINDCKLRIENSTGMIIDSGIELSIISRKGIDYQILRFPDGKIIITDGDQSVSFLKKYSGKIDSVTFCNIVDLSLNDRFTLYNQIKTRELFNAAFVDEDEPEKIRIFCDKCKSCTIEDLTYEVMDMPFGLSDLPIWYDLPDYYWLFLSVYNESI